MAVIETTRYNSLDEFRELTNEVSVRVGDTDTLTTTSGDLTSAINEHEVDIGDMVLTGLDATDISDGIRELTSELGQVTALLTEDQTSVVAAINEVHDDLGSLVALDTENKTSFTLAINEIHTDLGTVSTVTTTDKSDLVSAVNELDAEIGDLTTKNGTFASSTLVGMLNELDDEKVYLSSASQQTLNTDLYLPSGKTFTVDGTLDVTSGQLNVPTAGGELNISTAFVSLADPDNDTALNGGIILNRGDGGTATPLEDVRLYWDETVSEWRTKSFDDDGSTVNAKIVTRFNAKELFSDNTETNVNVTWDATNQNFDVSLIAEPVVSGITAGNITTGVVNDNTISTITGDLNINSNGGTTTIDDILIVSGDATFEGDLTVTGTTTYVNTNELNIGDNIFVLNADETGAPTENAGMEIERGTSANTSLLWNETADRWQFTDASGTYNLIRPAADAILTFRDGDGTTVTADTDDTLRFIEGSGIDVNFTDTGEPEFGLTITNTDRGSSQNIFKNVLVENSDTSDIATLVADNNNDTLTIRESTGIQLGASAASDVVTIGLANTTVAAGSYGSSVLVPVITVDAQGRITSASTTSVAGVQGFTYNSSTNILNLSTSDGASYDADIGDIGGSLTGTLADAKLQYGSNYNGTASQGSFFFDSLNQKLMVYTGSEFVDAVPQAAPIGGETSDAVATIEKYTYNITSSTNAISGSDANSKVLSYVIDGSQNVEVYVNGIKQVEGAGNDYVATTGTSVTLTYNLVSGDVVDVQVYELLTQDAFYLKTETYTQTETNTQISNAVSEYLPLAGGSLTGNLTIGGNLTISGTTTTVNTETVNIADNIILLNSNETGSPTQDGGITIERGTSPNKSFYWDESEDKWSIGTEALVTGSITSSGSISASNFTASSTVNTVDLNATGSIVETSDARLKSNVNTIADPIAKVSSLNGYTYNKEGIDKEMTGVIAQEVQSVLPQAVTEGEDGILSVSYGNMVGLLIEAIKDQQKQIDELKSMIAKS